MSFKGFWRWLGWGALGLGLVWTLRPERPAPRSRPRRRPSSEPAPAVEVSALPELPSTVETGWVPGPGGALRTADLHPEAEQVLLFVHGVGGSLEQWSAQLSALGSGLRGVAFDLPGHGGSDPAADGDCSVAALASALLAAADGCGLRRFVVVGHGLGATVALEAAARRPDRILGALLLDPPSDPTRLPEDERVDFLERLRADPRGEMAWTFRQLLVDSPSEVAERVLADLERADAETIAAAVEASFEHSPLAALERFEGVVWSLVSASNDLPESLHRLRPDLPTVRATGFGHWLMLEQVEACNRVLDQFLDEVRSHL